MVTTITFRAAVSTPLRKELTSAIAQNVDPRPCPKQFAKMTRNIKVNLGIRQPRSLVNDAALKIFAVAEGLAAEIIVSKGSMSYAAAEKILRDTAKSVRGYSAKKRRILLLHCLDFFGIETRGLHGGSPHKVA